MKRLFALILVFLIAGASADAYIRITSTSGNSPRWQSMPVRYWINDQGSSQIFNGSDFAAVHASFQTWQSVPTANIQFAYQGTTAVRSAGRDGQNVISFSGDASLLGSSTLAATYSFYSVQGSELFLSEADILFNSSFSWSTSGETTKYDIQSVLTHEIGHMLGLDHSGLVSSVMVPFGVPGQQDQRTLQYDDIAGVSEIYPGGPPVAKGLIRGSITAGGSPVFGAHVVAIDNSGTPLVSTLSQPDGSFFLRFLPPGDYRLVVEPLDLPVSEAYLGGWYRGLKTDFGTTYSGDVSTISQSQIVRVTPDVPEVMNIHVLAKSASGLNLTRPSFAARITRGTGGTLTMSGQDLSSGVVFSSSSPAITLGSPTFGVNAGSTIAPTFAAMPISAFAGVALGPKNIAVNRGTDASVGTGAIVIVDPQPSSISVSPPSGPTAAQNRVTISGTNFRTGARVYFGGLPSADVLFVSSTSLDVLAPSNTPGPANVLVMNTDGTNGVATNAYTYLNSPPAISQVSPLTGPPGTLVTIDGAQFDARPQNIDVRFNGTIARVLGSTITQIQTFVPFGATSGPVTVTVAGQSVTGPNFTVTAAPISTNLALANYQFIDSSPSAGGTSLSFISNDDALSTLALPFTFGFFGTIYPAGSPLYVTTNGWLSLESPASVAYLNGPLPGKTVTAGSDAGSIPAALMAPFFDDLVMVPGVSSVSIRNVGTAPNRRLIVQWSRMSILNEDGDNLNADLTFQAVLFEGSNDIQFAYNSMSGPRSDGSSATIGIQDPLRTTGIQTSYNQSTTRGGFFATYRFQNGTYAQFLPAVTQPPGPPTKPIIQDGGAVTRSTSELNASWSSIAVESGIREYQYAVGRSAGAADVVPFTTTSQTSILLQGLTLLPGATYYFAVRAVSNAGLASEVGVSDGILVDPTAPMSAAIIPFAPQDSSQFTGIALLAPMATTVTLRARNADGTVISGAGVQNPATVTLAAGQQYVKLIDELFGIASFDGWIEVEAPIPGLGIFSATGSRDLSAIDAVVPRPPSSDFVVMHPGSTLVIVNPTTRPATLTISELETGARRTLTVPAQSRTATAIARVSRVQASELLAAVEKIESPGRLGLWIPEDYAGQASLTFPQGVIGGGYTTTLRLVNATDTAADATVRFGSASRAIHIEPNSVQAVSLGDFLQLPQGQTLSDAVRVTGIVKPFSSPPGLVGVVDIENATSWTSLGARPGSTTTTFPQVAQGSGWFTGLALVTGDVGATITVDVYPPTGGTPKSVTITLGPNQQLARLLSEIVPGFTIQMSGYIRVHSDQPIWSWEIYGTDGAMASGPPL